MVYWGYGAWDGGGVDGAHCSPQRNALDAKSCNRRNFRRRAPSLCAALPELLDELRKHRSPPLLPRQKMPREAELSLNEREFILQALGENIRLDGRAFDAFRDLDLTFGDEYGVADVRLGKTRCAASCFASTL